MNYFLFSQETPQSKRKWTGMAGSWVRWTQEKLATGLYKEIVCPHTGEVVLKHYSGSVIGWMEEAAAKATGLIPNE